MRPSRPRSLRWFVALALLSGAGLLAGGLVSLWRMAREADRAAGASAESVVLLTARAIRLILLDPRLPADQASLARSFRVEDGSLVLEPPYTWAEAPLPESPELELPARVADRLAQAEAAQLGGDEAAARAAIDEALAESAALEPRSRDFVRHGAMWLAHRRGDVETAAALHESLLPAADDPLPTAETMHSTAGAGVVVMAVTRGRTLPGTRWLEAVLARLPPQQLDALERRVLELRSAAAPRGRAWSEQDWEDFDRTLERVRTQRRTLRAAAARLGRLATAELPVIEGVGDELLVYHAEQEGRGIGALIDPRAIRFGSAEPDGGARIVFGADLPRDAFVVFPGIGVVPVVPAARGFFGHGLGLGSLLVALAATLGIGLAASLRMLRREAALTQARADFLTSVTHELKTPLASIRLLSEMLLEGRVDGDAKRAEYHGLLAGEAERLSTLIENVLDLGRLERGERALDVRDHPLGGIVRETVGRFAPLAQRDGLAVRFAPSEPELAVRCDRGALEQVLWNLLDNARKYAGEGGRVEIDARAGDSQGMARLRVRDFGRGVAASERESIFEPFVRGEGQKDGSTPGLGLGLHLARGLLRSFGGDLRCVDPEDGGAGACFEATLPCGAWEPAR